MYIFTRKCGSPICHFYWLRDNIQHTIYWIFTQAKLSLSTYLPLWNIEHCLQFRRNSNFFFYFSVEIDCGEIPTSMWQPRDGWWSLVKTKLGRCFSESGICWQQFPLLCFPFFSVIFFLSSYQFFCEENAGTLSTMDYTQVRLVSQPFQFVSKEIKKKKRHGNHAVTSQISFVSESAFITVKWSVLSTNLDKNSFVIFLGWDAATIFTDTKRPLT